MKRIILFIASLLVCTTVFAANFLEGVTLSINSTDGQYAKGDSVIFTVNRTSNPAETYLLSIYHDSVLKSSEEVTVPQGKSRIYAFASDESKAIQVRLSDVIDTKLYQEVGAVVAPEGFMPGFEEPADFMAYWKDEIKKMRKAKPQVQLTLMATNYKNLNVYDLEISMPDGNPVRGYMAIPKKAAKKSLPALLHVHGAGVNKPGNRSSIKTVGNCASMGCIALDINAHGMLNDQPQSYYDDLADGELKGHRRRILTTKEEYYFRLMVLRAIRANDYLCKRPEWDGKRLIVRGSSQGGFQAAAVAGLDDRVTYAEVVVPAHTDLAGSRKGRRDPWPGAFQQSEKKTPELTDVILPYFDGALFLKYAKGKVVVEAGLTDPTCPAGCVLAAYNNCQSADKVLFTYPYRPHGQYGITEAARIKEWERNVSDVRAAMLKQYITGKEDKSAVVYLLGDSTCCPYAERHRPRFGWGEKLQDYLDGFIVKDKASSGRSTKSFIEEGRWTSVMDSLKRGDYVFIQFSHNDEKLQDEKRGTQPFGDFYDNLCRFINDTRSKGATPVLLTPVCRRSFNKDGSVKFTHKDYPAAIKKAGADTQTTVLDIEQATAEWLAKLGKEASAAKFMYSVNQKDNTHFVEEGADEVAAMVAKAMAASGDNGLAKLVKK